MRKKSIICLLWVVLIQFSFHICFNTFAASSGIDILPGAISGGFVDVTVSINSNPGMASFLLKLQFNSQKLLPVSITKGAMLVSKGVFSSNAMSGDLSGLTYIQAYFVSTSNLTSNGTLFTVRFQVKNNAIGLAHFYIDPSSEIINQSETDLQFPYTSANLTITQMPVMVNITSSTLAQSNGKISGNVQANVSSNLSGSTNAICFLAIYNPNGQLVSYHIQNNVLLQPGANSMTFQINNAPVATSDFFKAKVILWTDAMRMLPLAENDMCIFK